MGSVPRINRPLAIVSWEYYSPFLDNTFYVVDVINKKTIVNLFYWYNNQSKGVSILSLNYLIP